LKKNQKIKSKDNSYDWKHRNSEFTGYGKAYYVNTDGNDYLRADISKTGDAVRLYIELESEGGAGYVSIIKDGNITLEKSTASNRQGDFSGKFAAKAKIFATLPSNLFIKLVGNNYGIVPKASESKSLKNKRSEILEQTKKRYFKEKKVDISQEENYSERKLTPKVVLFDLIDYLIGAAIAISAFFVFNYDYTILGIVLAVFGITIGAVDIFIRAKEVSILKVLIFVLAGISFYIYDVYGYFWIN